MIDAFLTTMVVKTAKGFAWKAMIQGQPDDHIMDWQGSNYKFLVVKGQPRYGFPTETHAMEFLEGVDQLAELDRTWDATGSYYPDLTGKEMRDFEAGTRHHDRLGIEVDGV